MGKESFKACDHSLINGQDDDNSSNSSNSDMSIDFNTSNPIFESSGSSQFSKAIRPKPGLGMINISSDVKTGSREASHPHPHPHLWSTKSLFFQNDVKPDNLRKPRIFSLSYLVQLPPDLHAFDDTVYESRQDPFAKKVVRFIWPCILASQKIKFVLSGTGFDYASGSFPVAICSKHGNVGFLKLEEIENNEGYTLVIHHHHYPDDSRVVHMNNQCVLSFHEKNGQVSKNFRLEFYSSDGGTKNPHVKSNFLKNCQTCEKSLEGEDIYIYRGDSSFCSEECRDVEIEADKKRKKMMKVSATTCTKNTASPCKEKMFFIS